jgi:endoglycosylceramidase
VLGYDLFNEPFPGTDWQPCATANGCSAFDEGALGEFYAKLVPALEAADSNHIVFYEPLIFFDGGAETHVPSPSGPRVGMSFHDYEPANFKRPLDNALNQSKSTGDALLMTEFGASVDAAPVVEVANLADTFMMSWLYWTYANGTPYLIASSSGFPPPQQQGVVINLALPRTGTNVNQAVLTAISRPYPQTIAGTPQSFSFDPKSGKFQLAYSTAGLGPSLKSSETDILVPLTQYPNGYTATVAGGRVVSSPNSRLLRIAAKSNSGGTVSVQVVPK